MARTDSMATIDAALQNASLATSTGASPDDASPDVSIAPGLDTDAPLTALTADQKRAYDANRQRAIDQKAEQEKLLRDQDAAAKQQLATEKAEEDAFKSSARATVQGAKKIVRNTGVTLGNLPQPGSIVLPLVVLIVFFLLLIPVNGHTRFVWLWMVLSGNATIGQSSPNGSGGSGGSGGSASTPDAAPTGVGSVLNDVTNAGTNIFNDGTLLPFVNAGANLFNIYTEDTSA
jgi:hypothetical protein